MLRPACCLLLLLTVATTAAQLGDWFYMRGYEGYLGPAEVAGLPVIGSRVFKQEGKPVAQFVIEQHDAVVFEFHAADFGVKLPDNGDWQVIEREDWVAAIRQRGEHCFMIAMRGGADGMHALLKAFPKK